MKRVIGTFFSFLIVIVLVIWGLGNLADITERKDSKNKFSDFYQQEADYDVLFLGSSHVLNGIFPMELWDEYGIVSYNMAGYGNRMAMNYWMLKNALEYTSPQLVVVDCYMLGKDEKTGTIDQLHMSTDHIPYSETKVEMIRDLVEDEEQKKDFLWKFNLYHNRWNELTTADFDRKYSLEKGAESRIAVTEPEEIEEYDESYELEQETTGMEYLSKIIELCQKQEIQLLLTYIPFTGNAGWQPEMNEAADMAEKYDINYLDYYTLLEQLNVNTDYYDASHLNPSGARKITDYIGEYIFIEYDIEDQSENEAYEQWYEDYKKYTAFKHENIKKEKELKSYLMLLNDKNLSYGVYLKWEMDLEEYPVINELLLNMEVDRQKVKEEGKLFVLVDRVNEEFSMITDFEDMDTYFGKFELLYDDEGELIVIHEEKTKMNITEDDIAVFVFDNDSLSMVDKAKFKLENQKVSIERD